MIDEGPNVMRFELERVRSNGDGWTIGVPVDLTAQTVQAAVPAPTDIWVDGRLPAKSKPRLIARINAYRHRRHRGGKV
jgi:hypothetical protein